MKPDWKEYDLRLRKFLSRCWIPADDKEQEIYNDVERVFLGYVETIAKQYARDVNSSEKNEK